MFIADTGNQRVVKVTPDGIQTTVAERFTIRPNGLAVDDGGNLFVADSDSDSPGDSRNKVVQIAPNGTQTDFRTGLADPAGVAVTTRPTVLNPGSVDFGTQGPGTVGPAKVFTLQSYSNGVMIGRARVTGASNDDYWISQDNCSGETLGDGQICTVHVRFAPQASDPSHDAKLQVATTDGTDYSTLTGTSKAAGVPRERLVVCRRDTHRRDKAVLCTVRYNNHGRPHVVASLSRNGNTYATGGARHGKPLRLKATVHVTGGHYRLARTYNHGKTYYDKVRVLIIR